VKPGQDPRIVRVGCFDWRYRDGRLEFRSGPGHPWHEDPHKPEDYAAIAELKNHPTIVREVTAA
jgi:hypothetical protein